MVDTLSIPKSKVFARIRTGPIAEIPQVIGSLDKRPSTGGITGSVVIQIIAISTRKIAIFQAVNRVVYERVNTSR